MAFLVAEGGHRQELAKPSNLVGSQPGAESQLLPSLGIAPQHYRIERSEAGWQISPVAGVTALNGTPISNPSPLRHGDRIEQMGRQDRQTDVQTARSSCRIAGCCALRLPYPEQPERCQDLGAWQGSGH